MTESLRIYARFFKAFYLTNWVFYLLAALTLLFADMGVLHRNHGEGFPWIIVLAPFVIFASMQSQEREAGRLRAVLALPIAPRMLATWWWLTGCLLPAAIAEAGRAVIRCFFTDSISARLEPVQGAIWMHPGIFLLASSLIYCGFLLLQWLGIQARETRRSGLLGINGLLLASWLAALYIALRAYGFLGAGFVFPVAPFAFCFAAIGWLASPLLLPSRGFLMQTRSAAPPSHSVSAGGGYPAPDRWGGFRPISDLALQTLLLGVGIGFITVALSVMVFQIPFPTPNDMADHGTTLAGFVMTMLIFYWLILGIANASGWTLSLRAMRVLPWNRQALTGFLAGRILVSLAVALALWLGFCFAIGAKEIGVSAASLVTAGGAGLLALPLVGRFGVRGGLAGYYGGTIVGFISLAHRAQMDSSAIVIGLLLAIGSLIWFKAQLSGTRIYKLRSPAGRQRL